MPARKFSYTAEVTPPWGTTRSQIFVAVKIAMKYSSRLPKPDELMRDFGMCRATAYRWISAIRDARGVSKEAA